ncbi:MAG: hypothetical protein K9K62_04450 [Desulfobacteraceae bacterium]|nr:hypothetical protein [Desulfobacteraceae bacterium]
MSAHRRPMKGLQSIRTLSGKADLISEPYRAYMRITALEMEKARKEKERQSAMARVESIDARFREIESEKANLFALLEAGKAQTDEKKRITNKASGGSPAGFKVRY